MITEFANQKFTFVLNRSMKDERFNFVGKLSSLGKLRRKVEPYWSMEDSSTFSPVSADPPLS